MLAEVTVLGSIGMRFPIPLPEEIEGDSLQPNSRCAQAQSVSGRVTWEAGSIGTSAANAGQAGSTPVLAHHGGRGTHDLGDLPGGAGVSHA